MSAGSKVIDFQMSAQNNEPQKSAGAERTLKLMSAGVLIRGNAVIYIKEALCMMTL